MYVYVYIYIYIFIFSKLLKKLLKVPATRAAEMSSKKSSSTTVDKPKNQSPSRGRLRKYFT